jgi:hypothetical protein
MRLCDMLNMAKRSLLVMVHMNDTFRGDHSRSIEERTMAILDRFSEEDTFNL